MAGDEWGPWIDHDGKGCPCVGKWVQALHDNERTFEGIAGSQGGYSWYWINSHSHTRVLRYRIRKPRALYMLERIARDVDALVDA